MPSRELFAFVVGPLVVAGIVWLPAWVFLAAVAVTVVLAGDELLRMSAGAGVTASRWLALVLLAAVMVAAWSRGPDGFAVAAAATVVLLPAARLCHRSGPAGSLAGVAIGVYTVLGLGLCGACLGWLRTLPGDAQGWRLLLFFLFTIWLGDSGAYYVGRNLGRHKMSPQISPNKTWEGFAGGVITSLLAAAAAREVLGVALGWPDTCALAIILALAAPVGDLVESQFKRDTGVKDSSHALPGHGGFLDRTDSLLYAAPLVVGYLLAMGALP